MAQVFRYGVELLAAAALVILAMDVVLVLRIGPVILPLTAERGVHSGDLLGVMASLGAIALLARSAVWQAARNAVVPFPGATST